MSHIANWFFWPSQPVWKQGVWGCWGRALFATTRATWLAASSTITPRAWNDNWATAPLFTFNLVISIGAASAWHIDRQDGPQRLVMMALHRSSSEGATVRVHLGALKEEIRQIVLMNIYYCCYYCCYCSYYSYCYCLLHSRRIWEVLEMVVFTKERAGWTSCSRRNIYHFSFLPSPLHSFHSLSHGSVPFFCLLSTPFFVSWPLLLVTGACKTPREPEVSFRSWMCSKEWSSKLKNVIKNGPPVKNVARTIPQN